MPRPVLPVMGALFALLLPLTEARANDGFGGLSATGLTFGRTDAVAMISEDLFISPDRITVDYVFHNHTDSDVTGEVIFPLPPVPLWTLWEGMMNLPEPPLPDNLVGFTVTVGGQPVTPQIDRIAVIEDWSEDHSGSAFYDTPGRDVTARLTELGIPVSLDITAAMAALLALPPDLQAKAAQEGLAEYFEADPANGQPATVYPQWSILLRYHWTQTFPAGADLAVSHAYANHPPGGVFYWQHPPAEDYLQDYRDRYCIDDGTSAAIAKALAMPPDDTGAVQSYGMAYFLSYVLRTANSWSGPIGRFRLTLDKGDPQNILSLCAEGVTKTGPTTFVVEKTDYTPDRDLEILIAVPMQH